MRTATATQRLSALRTRVRFAMGSAMKAFTADPTADNWNALQRSMLAYQQASQVARLPQDKWAVDVLKELSATLERLDYDAVGLLSDDEAVQVVFNGSGLSPADVRRILGA